MAPPACEAYNQATIAWTWDRKALMTDYYPLIADAVADLGKPDEIGRVFADFQKYLYRREAAA